MADALGNPTGFALGPGQEHDLAGADALLPDLAADALIGDKAFDAEERVLEPLAWSTYSCTREKPRLGRALN